MMMNILNRLGIVLHWVVFLFWPLFWIAFAVVSGVHPLMNYDVPVFTWLITVGTYIAPAIIFFILKGRLILFPWNH
jgi:hypothetical protein